MVLTNLLKLNGNFIPTLMQNHTINVNLQNRETILKDIYKIYFLLIIYYNMLELQGWKDSTAGREVGHLPCTWMTQIQSLVSFMVP